jgi:hypothetical protein
MEIVKNPYDTSYRLPIFANLRSTKDADDMVQTSFGIIPDAVKKKLDDFKADNDIDKLNATREELLTSIHYIDNLLKPPIYYWNVEAFPEWFMQILLDGDISRADYDFVINWRIVVAQIDSFNHHNVFWHFVAKPEKTSRAYVRDIEPSFVKGDYWVLFHNGNSNLDKAEILAGIRLTKGEVELLDTLLRRIHAMQKVKEHEKRAAQEAYFKRSIK